MPFVILMRKQNLNNTNSCVSQTWHTKEKEQQSHIVHRDSSSVPFWVTNGDDQNRCHWRENKDNLNTIDVYFQPRHLSSRGGQTNPYIGSLRTLEFEDKRSLLYEIPHWQVISRPPHSLYTRAWGLKGSRKF